MLNLIKGTIVRVAGPVVSAKGLKGARIYEVVRVGEEKLIGEIISLKEDVGIIQVYEETTGLKPGDHVYLTGESLSVELGPGIIGQIYDGIQRPLPEIRKRIGDFVFRGASMPALPRNKKWNFKPLKKIGDFVSSGDIIGVVQETPLVDHKIMVPPGIEGKIIDIAKEGDYTVEDVMAVIVKNHEKKYLTMVQKWPVRIARPYVQKLPPDEPLITGQRVIDTFFPVAKGGTATIPGGFGTGKTVTQHQLAKWSHAKVIVYVGCGERGNEMTEVLEKFPELTDPLTGRPLMERTVLIANVSNMPVAAREASIYTGVTIAEYFRDMGYDVALMADSTSRWAEALREISGRLEEMPGEEGFPPYLSARLAEFYERSGKVIALGLDKRIGSVTIIGAVSPPGGDFSEPVVQSTLRLVKVFWALDKSLAERRHFPAINWLTSYSLYIDSIKDWYHKNLAYDWIEIVKEAMSILQKEDELKEIVKLVGPDALPESDREILEVSRMIREDFLTQHAYHSVDSYCPLEKSYLMLKAIIQFHREAKAKISEGIPLSRIMSLPIKDELARMKIVPFSEFNKIYEQIIHRMKEQFSKLTK
ncbi:MAG: ATP synthase subunit A [Candidatus Methanomethylicia archaeon]|nr:ATP synthase subunit A [Candidatus Methanomethylicia archaeon]MCX8169116.1 ATP synthase subunit A [Candidatus Methanomethylicia archaeon]MDW7988848.1 ATP synthase subunit A [Nitrososphaerota archaeon]